MECGASSNLSAYIGDAKRVVEAQHITSTRKLVDSDEEQELLEQLIDQQKPPMPDDGKRFHYLLYTPFRYPPLRHGSRFGTRAERGIWYGSEQIRTALAEVAYYRLVFLEGTSAQLGTVIVDLTSFEVALRCDRFVDLTDVAFADFAQEIASPTHYGRAQQLGADMRAAHVTAFRYRSARDRYRGINLGIFSSSVFASRFPTGFRTWRCVTTKAKVEISGKDYLQRVRYQFPREDFEVQGKLPAPAL